eukprot:CAMPEP_0198212684 /NCGR_PEP_ID=MMETSP1445-20131203/27202_1 /TAXON_ID=36898 /ORGANISM="Pyramimonas sp., Strain CCMP2087" /LENGTH=241 /DNA_ID=CAMNT_0043887201 /DNA_START=175 /DNA_END=900 /DNA_ORIENTATION=+
MSAEPKKRKVEQAKLSFATSSKVSRTDAVKRDAKSSDTDAKSSPLGATSHDSSDEKKARKAHQWSVVDGTLLAFTGGDIHATSTKVASFDLDGTLVNTKGGNTFAKHAGDFVHFNEHVKPKLTELHESGYRLVIFSNQNGIKKAITGVKATATKSRINQFIKSAGVPMEAFCATQKDEFRKPDTGMWERLVSATSGDAKPVAADSIYVGDAAGRPKDFSDSDAKFAKAVGLTFYTPEEFFK